MGTAVKIGVLTDMSSLYSDIGEAGSVADLRLVIFLDRSNFVLQLFDLIIHRGRRLSQARAWQAG